MTFVRKEEVAARRRLVLRYLSTTCRRAMQGLCSHSAQLTMTIILPLNKAAGNCVAYCIPFIAEVRGSAPFFF